MISYKLIFFFYILHLNDLLTSAYRMQYTGVEGGHRYATQGLRERTGRPPPSGAQAAGRGLEPKRSRPTSGLSRKFRHALAR